MSIPSEPGRGPHPLVVIACLVVIVCGAVYLWNSHAQGCHDGYFNSGRIGWGCGEEAATQRIEEGIWRQTRG